MRRRELDRKLNAIARAKGWEMTITEGGSHSKVVIGPKTLIVPRGDINEYTAKAILRDAEAIESKPEEE